MDRAGIPFVSVPLFMSGVLFAFDIWWGGAGCGFLGVCLALFFRDPNRKVLSSAENNAILAPADGKVVHAGKVEVAAEPDEPGEWSQISIFLSPLDVHVNRTPVGGRVIGVRHKRGRFLPAYHKLSAVDNERCEIVIDHNGQHIIFRQVVGILARRVVCRIKPGMTVERGQRFGIMMFGSRMDVFVPRSAAVLTKIGDKVRGGESVIAMLSD